MEYTKDIILDIGRKREIKINKLKNCASNVKRTISKNKLIVIWMSIFVSLIAIDIILVNSFLQLLTRLY